MLDSEIKESLSRLSREERVVILSIKQHLEESFSLHLKSFEVERANLQAALANSQREIDSLKKQVSDWELYMKEIHEKGELLNVVDLEKTMEATFERIVKQVEGRLDAQTKKLLDAWNRLERHLDVVQRNKFNNFVSLFRLLKDAFSLQEGMIFEFQMFTLAQFKTLGASSGWIPYCTNGQGLTLCFHVEKDGKIARNEAYAKLLANIDDWKEENLKELSLEDS